MLRHFTCMEVSTIVRVLCSIERQIAKAHRQRRWADAEKMCFILGQLQAKLFMTMEAGQGWFDGPLAVGAERYKEDEK
jgi:hypothetical protein